MVNINIPTIQKSTQPTLITPAIDSGALQAAQNTANQYSAQLNQELANLDKASTEESRAKFVAAEQQHQLDLAMPESLNKIQNISINAINTLAAMDEAKRRSDQANLDKSYTINAGLQLQSDYEAYTRQASSNMNVDGSGYAESIQSFLNNNIKHYLDNAPSQEAKLDLYGKLGEFKIRAISKAFDEEDKQRLNYRLGLATNSVNSMINEAITNPDSTNELINQLPDIAKVLSDNGVNDAGINEFIYNSKASLINAQISGTLNSQNPTNAVNLLSNEEVRNSLPAEQYGKLLDQTYTVVRNYIKEQSKQADKAMTLQAYTANLLPKGSKGYNEAADSAATQMLFSNLKDTSSILANDIPGIASSISSYFKQYSSGLGKETSALIANKILASNNPYEVAAYSIGMNSLAQDPTGGRNAPFLDLSEDAQTMATRVSNLTSFGIDAKSAVEMARKEIQVSKQPGVSQELNQILSPTGTDPIVKDVVNSALGVSLFKYITNGFTGSGLDEYNSAVIEADSSYLLRANLVKYKNIDLAQQETVKQIKYKYARTDVDGEGRVMEAAPEMFYDDARLEKFKVDLSTQKELLAKQYGLNTSDLYIQAIPGRTTEQNPNKLVQYYIYNKVTGLPVQDKDYNFAVFNFRADQTEYGKKLTEANLALSQKRDVLNSQANNNIYNLSLWKDTMNNKL